MRVAPDETVCVQDLECMLRIAFRNKRNGPPLIRDLQRIRGQVKATSILEHCHNLNAR